MSVNAVSMFALLVLVEVEPDTSDIFSRSCVWVIYEVPIFTLLVTILILAPLGSLIVSNYNNIVFCGLDSNEFNRFRFLFVRVG